MADKSNVRPNRFYVLLQKAYDATIQVLNPHRSMNKVNSNKLLI
jgi:hypothetical protein